MYRCVSVGLVYSLVYSSLLVWILTVVSKKLTSVVSGFMCEFNRLMDTIQIFNKFLELSFTMSPNHEDVIYKPFPN